MVAPPSVTATSLPRGSRFIGSSPASDRVSNSISPLAALRAATYVAASQFPLGGGDRGTEFTPLFQLDPDWSE
ncbi:MAG: hypothetical protein MUF27_13090 [Acidobacteria bacterium]|jgi:hypothetical protein|nr:hypothetical protein [Acidobacteriota bacterium]